MAMRNLFASILCRKKKQYEPQAETVVSDQNKSWPIEKSNSIKQVWWGLTRHISNEHMYKYILIFITLMS